MKLWRKYKDKEKEKEQEKDVYGNTHRLFNINEFIFDEKIKKEVGKLLSLYRDEFKPQLLNSNGGSDIGMMLETTPLTMELKSYYNNDLCLSVATSIAVARDTKFNIRTHAYYAENALNRISNAWEYLFIILNQFLQTDLIIGNDLRNRIIETKCYNIDFIKKDNIFRPIITDLPDKEIEERKLILKKEHKLFNISTKKKSNSFLKALKKKYSLNENIQVILELYFSNDVKEIIDLRNEIVHRRPLGAKFTVAPINPFPAQGISIDPKGWFDFKDLDIKLEKNLSAIRIAIQQIINIIFTNEVPIEKCNEGKTFFVYNVECSNCSKELLINDITVEYFKSRNELLICPYCEKSNTFIKDKREVHDRYYYSNLQEYDEFIFKFWKNDK